MLSRNAFKIYDHSQIQSMWGKQYRNDLQRKRVRTLLAKNKWDDTCLNKVFNSKYIHKWQIYG